MAVEIKNVLVGEAYYFAADPPFDLARTGAFGPGPITRISAGRYFLPLNEKFDPERVLITVQTKTGFPMFFDGRVLGAVQDILEVRFWDAAAVPTDFVLFTIQLWTFPSDLEDLF